MVDDDRPPFPTKEELKQLIADRERDLDRLAPKYQPRWMIDADDAVWERMRQRERKIIRLETRLDKATRRFETDFDQTS